MHRGAKIKSDLGEGHEERSIDTNDDQVNDDVQTWMFQGCLVHATLEQDMDILENMVIGVQRGKIVFVEPSSKGPDLIRQFHIPSDGLVKMTNSQFLMPGFVDCHAHASQYSFLGTGSDMELIGWLDKYTFPAEKQLKQEPDRGLSLYTKCVDRTIKNGTTSISYYATTDRQSTMALVKALESRGQRAFVGKVNMDMNGPQDYIETTEDSVQDTQRFVSDLLQRNNPLVHPCITPRFALSCSMKLMKELSVIANNHSLPVQTHLSENVGEVQAVLEQFPQCATYTQIYHEAGLLGDRTMLAHAIHVSQPELQLIKANNCGICHCPNSNFSLTSGVMDLQKILGREIKVGLGTDFGAGSSPSMLDAIRRGLDAAKIHQFGRRHQDNNPKTCLTSSCNRDNNIKEADDNTINTGNTSDDSVGSQINNDILPNRPHKVCPQEQQQQCQPTDVQSPITYKHLFRLATLGSSQVMGLDEVIGNFEVGKDFDAILVDVKTPNSPIDIFPTDTREDVIQKFLFVGDDRNITRVFVQGRQIMKRND